MSTPTPSKPSGSSHGRALLVAAAFAFLGVASLFMYMKQLRLEASGGQRIAVLVLARQVPKSAALTDDDLATRTIPAAYVDERMVRATDRGKVLGIRLQRPLDPGQTIEWPDLALGANLDSDLAKRIPEGMRALTLHIPAQYMSVSLIRPGYFVDLIAIPEEGKHQQQSIVLLQKVLVLASGNELTPVHTGQGSSRTEQLLTVAVTVQESQTIALATTKGPVIAIARPESDITVVSRPAAVTAVGPIRTAAPAPTTGPRAPTEITAVGVR